MNHIQLLWTMLHYRAKKIIDTLKSWINRKYLPYGYLFFLFVGSFVTMCKNCNNLHWKCYIFNFWEILISSFLQSVRKWDKTVGSWHGNNLANGQCLSPLHGPKLFLSHVSWCPLSMKKYTTVKDFWRLLSLISLRQVAGWCRNRLGTH